MNAPSMSVIRRLWEIFEIGEGWKKTGPGDVTVECKYKGNFEIFLIHFMESMEFRITF